jgi:autotransporter-associated beta strand protein
MASSIGANASTSPIDFQINNAYLKYGGATTISTNKGLTLGGTSDTLEVTNPGTILSVSGIVTGTGNLVKTGAGILNFKSSANTFAGSTTVKGGILSLGDEIANTNGINTGSVTLNGGTLIMFSATGSYNHLTNNLIVPTGSTGRLETDARCFLDGTLTGGGTLNYYVSYVRTEIAGDWSAFTGTINVLTDGTADFRFNNANGLPNAKVNIQNAAAVYKLGGGAFEIGELSGILTANLTDGNWIVGGLNTNATFNGVISGASVTKKGTGKWTLTNANTYTGGTTINEGNLIVTNTNGSATGTGVVTTNNNGVLSGTGIISGPIIVNSGGTLASGNIFGTLTVNSTVTMLPGSKMSVDVNSSSGLSDKLSTGANKLTLNGTLEMINAATTPYEAGNSFTIFIGSNISGSFSSIVPENPGVGLVWDTTLLRNEGKISVAFVTSIGVISNSSNIKLYPNPSSGKFTIECKDFTNNITISVENTNGAKILSKEYKSASSKLDIDLSHFSKGIYILRIISGNKIYLEKVIIDK